MLSFLPAPILGLVSFLLLSVNTLFWFFPLMFFTLLKVLIPFGPWRNSCNRALDFIATTWININNFNIYWTRKIHWEVKGVENLKKDDWYLVISNHQTWVDILVLQKIFSNKIPFLKFFLKKELIFVPLLGICWWALDFPFMKRYSKAFLKKNPHLRGKDVEVTKRACKKFQHIPVSVMNFVEGTRFTIEKSGAHNSPYKNLMLPKAGGIAFVLEAMGNILHKIVDVTIYYPSGVTGLWGFLCGRIQRIRVNVNVIDITDDLLGDYTSDPVFRKDFQEWLALLWKKKDLLIESYKVQA